MDASDIDPKGVAQTASMGDPGGVDVTYGIGFRRSCRPTAIERRRSQRLQPYRLNNIVGEKLFPILANCFPKQSTIERSEAFPSTGEREEGLDRLYFARCAEIITASRRRAVLLFSGTE